MIVFWLFQFTSNVLQLIGIDDHQQCFGFLLFYLRCERCLSDPGGPAPYHSFWDGVRSVVRASC